MYDVKAGHITLADPKESRRTFSAGSFENISHQVQYSAAAYDFKLRALAVLSGMLMGKIKESLDFWIIDRAGGYSAIL